MSAGRYDSLLLAVSQTQTLCRVHKQTLNACVLGEAHAAIIALLGENARLEVQVAAVREARAYWDIRYYSDAAIAVAFCGDIDRALGDTKASNT